MRSGSIVAAFAGLVAAGGLLAGCGRQNVPVAAAGPALPPCDTVASTATTPSRGTSLAYAQRSLGQIYPDARGDLLGAGWRRIRIISRDQSCKPYRVAGLDTGLVTCTVKARVCGR